MGGKIIQFILNHGNISGEVVTVTWQAFKSPLVDKALYYILFSNCMINKLLTGDYRLYSIVEMK